MSYINENSFSRWIIEKSDGLTMLGLQKISELVRDHAYLILTSQTSTRGQIVGHEARNLDAQRTFLNSFENMVNRRVNIPEDIGRFQKTLQYARSKVDYVIGEFIYMLPSNMNLQIGKVEDYNNKILISSPSFKIGTNLKINLDVKSKEVAMVKTEPDVIELDKLNVKPKVITKLTSRPMKNTNKMLNLTSSSIEKAIRMLRNLIRIRSPMKKKRLLDIGNYSCLYSMVDV